MQQHCFHGIGNRIVGRNRYQTRRKFRRWLVSSVQFLKVLKTRIRDLGGGLVSCVQPALDLPKIGIQLHYLQTDVCLGALLAQKIAIRAARKGSVENDAIVRRKCGKSVFHKLLISLFGHLLRIHFIAQLRRGLLALFEILNLRE